MCSIWNRMAAVSVVDLQYAEIDSGRDILKLKALENCHGFHNSLEKNKLTQSLFGKLEFFFTWFDFICTFVLNYDKVSPS